MDHARVRPEPQQPVLDGGFERLRRVALRADPGRAQLARESIGRLAAGARDDDPPAAQLLGPRGGDERGRLSRPGLPLDHNELTVRAREPDRRLLLGR